MTRRWGTAYEWVFRFLSNRDGLTCYLCGQEKDEKGSANLVVEHKDNDKDNPDPTNLGLAHPSCNIKKNPPKQGFPQVVPLRESERKDGDGPRAEWSSEEGRRSDKMTYRYRQRLYHPNTGLFKNAGQIFPLNWLADVLPDELKIGKSTTYRKYINEDIASEYLEAKTIDGEVKLERTLKAYPGWKLGMEEEDSK